LIDALAAEARTIILPCARRIGADAATWNASVSGPGRIPWLGLAPWVLTVPSGPMMGI